MMIMGPPTAAQVCLLIIAQFQPSENSEYSFYILSLRVPQIKTISEAFFFIRKYRRYADIDNVPDQLCWTTTIISC